jgi:glutathionylspermidine synthase
VLDGVTVEEGPDQEYGAEGYVVQEYTDLGDYGGGRPVLGVWTVDMEPQGLGIRESDTLLTDNRSRFVPHIIS